MADNTELARSLYDAWNNRDFEYLTERIAPDGTITDMGSGQTFQGREEVDQYNTSWADAFPDGRITVDNVIAQGDHVVVEYTGHGTHTGTLDSPAGSIPATGRSVTLHLCDVIEFADGKVKSQHSYFDSAALMAQLGMTAGQSATTQ